MQSGESIQCSQPPSLFICPFGEILRLHTVLCFEKFLLPLLQIKREEVDRYSLASPAIPNCQIRLKWEDCQQKPEELIYTVELKGAKKPRNRINIIFEPGEQGRHNNVASYYIYVVCNVCVLM